MRAHAMGALAVGLLLSRVITFTQAPALPQGAAQPGPPAPRAQMPTRDGAAAEAPTGTARIRGRVVSADNGTPLRRAQVRISAAEVRVNRSVNTNAEGVYEFTELPAGRYNIFVTRSGFVSLQFGQRRPFESGRPLDVGNAQIVEKIDFALPRGGVIAGRVTDELGEPLAGVRMQAMRYQYLPSGQRQLVPASGLGMAYGITTNDLGEFRLYSLMPGTYIVSAAPSEMGMMMVMPGGPASAPHDGHGITYYPGTINVDEAQGITVGIAEVASASFALVPQRMTRVSGLVRDSQGKPLAANLMLRTQSEGGMMMRSGTMAGPDGRFSLANVPPGDHFIEVSPRPGSEESASVPIASAGQEITDLIITTSPGRTIGGQVTFEGAPAGQQSFRVNVSSPDPGLAPLTRIYDDTQGVVDDKGRFQIRGLSGGRAVFNLFPATPGGGAPTWSVKSVTIDGENVTDIPFDLSTARDDTKIEIVMTDKQTTISGTVRNARGEHVIDYTVVMFPAQMKEGVMAARYIRAVRPDQQGRFQARGLPPGDYFAVAVESLEQGGHFDPAFRKQLEPSAKRFTLKEGQTATVDLALAQ
jgi:Carboxypeptidase regulatory-like domain